MSDLFVRLTIAPFPGCLGAIPSRQSLTVLFDPGVMGHEEVRNHLLELLRASPSRDSSPRTTSPGGYPGPSVSGPGVAIPLPPRPRSREIPVVYGGEHGVDLEEVAHRAGTSPSELIRLHSRETYRVVMMGFAPGFAYLGDLPPILSLPRRRTPRPRIMGGAIGVAERFTAVYPSPTAGGWNLIGWTPIPMCRWDEEFPFFLAPGDTVRFHPIEPDEAARVPPSSPSSSKGGEDLFRVMEGGLCSTVQDHGRFGYQHLGVPISGPMDRFAAAVTNLLGGNETGCPLLEFTSPSPLLLTLTPVTVAVGGNAIGAEVNGRFVGEWRRFPLSPGDRLGFKRVGEGNWGYLAVAGGLAPPPVLGSAATCVPAGLGGIAGRGCRTGDLLARKAGERGRTLPPMEIPLPLFPGGRYGGGKGIRVIPGPDTADFSPEELSMFWGTSHSLSSRFDRAGYVFVGEGLPPKERRIEPDGVFPGVVQIPGDGKPLLLFWDGPTTGGYPRIGVVASVDLDRVAQIVPGKTVSFEPVSIPEAALLARERQQDLTRIREYLKGSATPEKGKSR